MQGGGGEEQLSMEELASNLFTYKDQLHQVKELLLDDPRNSELLDMQKELDESVSLICLKQANQSKAILVELEKMMAIASIVVALQVIALTEELLATAKKNEITKSNNVAGVNQSSSQRKASSGSISEHQEMFPVGTKVQAVYSEDGEWYDAIIESHTVNGYYVCYEGWGNKEEVDPDNVRPIQEGEVNALLEAERVAEATKQAIKRKIAQAASVDFQNRTLPTKLQIEPDDPEDVKAAKRKKIHAFKSKMRTEQLEVAQNKRQNDWQQFQTTKGKAKKIGFFSGRKRESIFKSPDDPNGKVGVTGSGKGLTEFQKREKHLLLKGANVEAGDD